MKFLVFFALVSYLQAFAPQNILRVVNQVNEVPQTQNHCSFTSYPKEKIPVKFGQEVIVLVGYKCEQSTTFVSSWEYMPLEGQVTTKEDKDLSVVVVTYRPIQKVNSHVTLYGGAYNPYEQSVRLEFDIVN